MRLTTNALRPACAFGVLVEPEADQQERAEADAFPADEDAPAGSRPSTRISIAPREQVQVAEEAACSRSSCSMYAVE